MCMNYWQILRSFRIVKFEQVKEYKPKGEIGKGGICFALMIEWFKRAMKYPDEIPQNRIQGLKEKMPSILYRQDIYANLISEEKITEIFGLMNALTKISKLWGVEFTYQWTPDKDELKTKLKKTSMADSFFYLSNNHHAIGIWTKKPNHIFDPNEGEFEYEDKDADKFWDAFLFYFQSNRYVLLEAKSTPTLFETFKFPLKK